MKLTRINKIPSDWVIIGTRVLNSKGEYPYANLWARSTESNPCHIEIINRNVCVKQWRNHQFSIPPQITTVSYL